MKKEKKIDIKKLLEDTNNLLKIIRQGKLDFIRLKKQVIWFKILTTIVSALMFLIVLNSMLFTIRFYPIFSIVVNFGLVAVVFYSYGHWMAKLSNIEEDIDKEIRDLDCRINELEYYKRHTKFLEVIGYEAIYKALNKR